MRSLILLIRLDRWSWTLRMSMVTLVSSSCLSTYGVATFKFGWIGLPRFLKHYTFEDLPGTGVGEMGLRSSKDWKFWGSELLLWKSDLSDGAIENVSKGEGRSGADSRVIWDGCCNSKILLLLFFENCPLTRGMVYWQLACFEWKERKHHAGICKEIVGVSSVLWWVGFLRELSVTQHDLLCLI